MTVRFSRPGLRHHTCTPMTHTSQAEPPPPDRCCAIIPHRVEPRALLLSGEQGWRLPEWVRDTEHGWSAAHRVNQRMADQLGIGVAMLRCVRRGLTGDSASPKLYAYWMENRSPAWELPPGACWAAREELETLEWAMPEHCAALEAWFADATAGAAPLHRPPWARPGWLDQACEGPLRAGTVGRLS